MLFCFTSARTHPMPRPLLSIEHIRTLIHTYARRYANNLKIYNGEAFSKTLNNFSVQSVLFSFSRKKQEKRGKKGTCDDGGALQLHHLTQLMFSQWKMMLIVLLLQLYTNLLLLLLFHPSCVCHYYPRYVCLAVDGGYLAGYY